MRILLAAIALSAVTASALAADKPAIRSRADLPQVRFKAAVPSQLLGTSALREMLPAAQKEAERLLREYDVQDTAMRSELRIGLAAIAIVEGRAADADRIIAQYRAEQTKPQLKRMGNAPMDVAAAIAGVRTNARCGAGVKRYQSLVTGADPQLVRDSVTQNSYLFQIVGKPFFSATAVGDLDTAAKQRGSIDVMDAMQLSIFEALSSVLPPCRAELTAAARTWLDAPGNAPRDIWPGRQPDAKTMQSAKPVAVAVWDHGYDLSLFPGQLAVDPAEPLDGRDNDGNGVSLLAKVKAALDDREKRRLDPDLEALARLQRTMVTAGPIAVVAPETVTTIQNAILCGRCVEFHYTTEERPEARWRRVIPYGLVHGPLTYLLGKMPARDDQPVYFRLDRMTVVTVSDTIGCAPDEWDIDAWLSDSFAVWRDEKQDVVLSVPPSSSARARHWRFHGQQRIEDLADGGLRIRFATGGMRELAEHLFTWGGELLIEGPDVLVAVMRERIAAAQTMLPNNVRPILSQDAATDSA